MEENAMSEEPTPFELLGELSGLSNVVLTGPASGRYYLMNEFVRQAGAFLVVPQSMHEQLITVLERDAKESAVAEGLRRDLAAYKILVSYRQRICEEINAVNGSTYPLPE